jgi:hypothetical protein
MKRSILCSVVCVLGLGLAASSSASVQTTSARAHAACRVDDPPPEPVECPFCGGNGQLHARRLVLLQERMNCVAMYATSW